MDSTTLDIPDQVESERLILRTARLEDVEAINAAIHESFNELHQWMPWARELPPLEQTQNFLRESQENFQSRIELGYQIRLKNDDTLIGMSSFHSPNWAVPRLEIGYWVRTSFVGQGYITEAVRRLTQLAFEGFSANRMEIRMDDRNQRSWRVAERAGYQLDGILRNHERTPTGDLRDTRIYSRVRLRDGSIVYKRSLFKN